MTLESLLTERSLVVLDGAMGSQLIARGLGAGECADAWNLGRPDDVEGILRGYVEAGADCVLTNTFGASPVALRRHGLEEETERINRAAVEVARRAAGERALVLGDIGPTGAMIEPLGDLSEAGAREGFARQAAALAEAGADAIICETFESAAEIRLGLVGARDACDLPLVASMKFNREPSGRYRTMMGDSPEDLVAAAAECGCTVVGTNCGRGIEEMVALVEVLAGLTELPLLAEANAGMPQLVGGETVYTEDASVFEVYVPELYRVGARVIGGCCGTTAEHVRVIRRFADSL